MMPGLMMGWLLLAQSAGIAPVAADEVVIEYKNATGFIRGRHFFPAENPGTGARGHGQFGMEITTQTIRHQVVQGGAAGGRVDLEVGNIFQGGAGDDLVVAHSHPNFAADGRMHTPGVFLLGEGGSDTLLGSAGADYLVSGSGYDRLHGQNGSDTYIITAHARATTVVADRVSPVAPHLTVEDANDRDIIRLPQGVKPEQLQLSWGAVWVDAVDAGPAHYPHPARALYPTIDFAWRPAQKIRIVLADPNDLDSSGIEVIQFADGISVSLGQLIAISKLASSFYQVRPR